MNECEALRLVINQSSANYKKEETVKNKMTYPLPPPSTIIGAIHNACGFTTYQPMNISIQGNYEALHKKLYRDNTFLTRVENDRNDLVKMVDKRYISNAHEIVAIALTKNVNFKSGDKIKVLNPKLYEEYVECKKIADSQFMTLAQGPMYYEILDNVHLIIHVSADIDVLEEIEKNAYNIKSIGRSEDFIDIESVEMVTLKKPDKCEVESKYSAYIAYENVKGENVLTRLRGTIKGGTVYNLNKNYKIEDSKRIFKKVKAVYLSDYVVDDFSSCKNLYKDTYNGENLIVNFL